MKTRFHLVKTVSSYPFKIYNVSSDRILLFPYQGTDPLSPQRRRNTRDQPDGQYSKNNDDKIEETHADRVTVDG